MIDLSLRKGRHFISLELFPTVVRKGLRVAGPEEPLGAGEVEPLVVEVVRTDAGTRYVFLWGTGIEILEIYLYIIYINCERSEVSVSERAEQALPD